MHLPLTARRSHGRRGDARNRDVRRIPKGELFGQEEKCSTHHSTLNSVSCPWGFASAREFPHFSKLSTNVHGRAMLPVLNRHLKTVINQRTLDAKDQKLLTASRGFDAGDQILMLYMFKNIERLLLVYAFKVAPIRSVSDAQKFFFTPWIGV